MKHKLYSLLLSVLLGMTGMQVWAQDLTTTEIEGVTYYEIGSADDLLVFADLVKNGEFNANAVLTADIALSEAWKAPIGISGGAYTGIFEGQGHKITGFEATSEIDGGGFFGVTSGATIQNFSIDGVLTSTAGTGSGVVGYPASSTIFNVHSTLDITVPVASVHHVGGVVGSARGGNIISNCTFAGTIYVAAGSTDNFAGVVAYLGGDSVSFCANYGDITFSDVNCTAGGVAGYLNNTTSYVKNCLNMGSLVCDEPEATPKYGGAIVGRLRTHDAARLTGNYWLEGSATAAGKDNNLASAVCFTKSQLPTGEVCYGLNGDQTIIGWYQTLGTDEQPVLDATHAQVYMNGHLHCDGTVYEGATYTNQHIDVIQDEHNFVDGFCSYCGLFDENNMTPNADGFYKIATAGQLIWFASKVNAGTYDANAILTADIDMTDADISVFPIGNPDASKRYIGTFDGQGHRFSNFQLINPSAANNFGMFNTNTGVVLRNFWLDNTCAIEGKELVGLVGRHDGGGTFEGVGNCANVTGQNNNIGGFFGGVFGNSSDKRQVTIKNCWTTGTVLTTNTAASNYLDCGALSGWFNNANISIEGFWTVAEVVNPKSESQYVFRNGAGASFTIKNCFSMYGAQANFPSFSYEQLASGEMAWMLNGASFIDPVWRQNLGEDSYPMPYGNRAVVYQTPGGYDCIAEDDPDSFDTFLSSVIANEQDFLVDLVAYQALLDQYREAIESWEDITGYADFIAAYKAAAELKEAIRQSAAAYASYAQTCDYVIRYLEENDVEGVWSTFLQTYLEEMVEPGANYPNGSYAYIMENLQLDSEAIAAETAFVNQMLENAIAGGIAPGTEITRLLANSTFADGFEGWTTEYEGGSITTGGVPELVTIARGLNNSSFNFCQTLSELPNGIYMMTTNGMFRAGADVTNQFYAGQLYLNGTANYVMSPGEDYIDIDEAEPGVNCLGAEGDAEYAIDGDILGYVPKSINGCSYAYSAGRYLNLVATEVTDGNLTVGVRNLGTGMANDWLPFGNLHVYYLGNEDEANEKLAGVVSAFAARAQIILDFVFDEYESYAQYPNMSEALKGQLAEAVEAAQDAATGQAKMALINRFSALFGEVHACRKAYIALLEAANKMQDYIDALDAAGLIDNDTYDVWSADIFAATDSYRNGDVSTEEALAIVEKFKSANLVPVPMSEDGVYQLATAEHVRIFSVLVNSGNSTLKADLTADIDMSELEEDVYFEPIGSTSNPFSGEFDGQNHKVTNFTMEYASGDKQGFFGFIKNAEVKNFSIDGAINFYGGAGVGAIGWSEGSTISNVHSSLDIAIIEKSTHMGGVCGDMRAGSSAIGCSFSGTIMETAGSHDCIGGISGYSNENCLYENCANYGTVSFTAANAYAGGICGYVNNDNFVGVKNCLNVGTVAMVNGAAPDYGGAFVGRLRNHANSKLENNYMLQGSAARAYGENSAAAETVTAEKLASGEVCYKLNGDQEEIHWFQTLGEDAYPVLFDKSLRVWYDESTGTYTNAEPGGVKGDLNGDGTVDIADAVTVLKLMAEGGDNAIADINGDGTVDIADFVTILNIMAQ